MRALEKAELRIKLANLELIPIQDGAKIIPKRIFLLLKNTKFISAKDRPLLAFALFCPDTDNIPFCYDRNLRIRTLKRITSDKGSQNHQIGRILIRGFFEILYPETNELNWVLLFKNDIRKIIESDSNNKHLLALFDKTPRQLAYLYSKDDFTHCLQKIGYGCINENSEFAKVIWQVMVINYTNKIKLHPTIKISDFIYDIKDFIFLNGSLRNADQATFNLNIQLLTAFINGIKSSYSTDLTQQERGILLDFAGWLEAANMRIGNASLGQLEQQLRTMALAKFHLDPAPDSIPASDKLSATSSEFPEDNDDPQKDAFPYTNKEPPDNMSNKTEGPKSWFRDLFNFFRR